MGALEGKIAFVTGASGGIGRTIALRIAEEGGDVALFARNAERLQETAEMVEALGRKAQCFPADVSDAAASKEAVNAALEAFGRVDVLVNNAGVTRDGLFMRMSESDWDDVMNINLKGVFNFSQAVTRTMMKQKSGSIISITSIIGLIGNAGQCNYAASKAGIIGFTKSLARSCITNIRRKTLSLTPQRFDHSSSLLQPFGITSEKRNIAALFSNSKCNSTTNSPGRTGHKCNFPIKSTHISLPYFSLTKHPL